MNLLITVSLICALHLFSALGPDLARQWYLFNKIQKYVAEADREILCPKPVTPLPTARLVIPLKRPVDEQSPPDLIGKKGKGRGKKYAHHSA